MSAPGSAAGARGGNPPVTITGTNFNTGSAGCTAVVYFVQDVDTSIPLVVGTGVEVVSASEITAVCPIPAANPPGAYDVRVFIDARSASIPGGFTVN